MSSTSILSFIASDFMPLQSLKTEQEQYAALMDEIGRYLPIGLHDVRAWQLNPNTDKGLRLFINTAGSWPDRPDPSCGIDNLFFAGDWVKNRVDLACMEGAASAALQAAHEIGEKWKATPGVTVPEPPLVAKRYPPGLIRMATWAVAPLMAAVWAFARITAPTPDAT
jgi:hypothetical protein